MSVALRKALYGKLTTTSTVTSKLATAVPGYQFAVYEGRAPSGADYPYIIFSKSSGTKRRAMQTPEAFKRETWLVKAVDRGTSSTTAEELAEAIDAALDGTALNLVSKSVVDLNHIGDIDYQETSGDQLYRHKGASYRITLT